MVCKKEREMENPETVYKSGMNTKLKIIFQYYNDWYNSSGLGAYNMRNLCHGRQNMLI